MDKKASLRINYLPGVDTIVLKQTLCNSAFITTDDSIVLGRGTFITILNYLVRNEIISPKVLAGLLEEYHTE
jgi:hypothetical protein